MSERELHAALSELLTAREQTNRVVLAALETIRADLIAALRVAELDEKARIDRLCGVMAFACLALQNLIDGLRLAENRSIN